MYTRNVVFCYLKVGLFLCLLAITACEVRRPVIIPSAKDEVGMMMRMQTPKKDRSSLSHTRSPTISPRTSSATIQNDRGGITIGIGTSVDNGIIHRKSRSSGGRKSNSRGKGVKGSQKKYTSGSKTTNDGDSRAFATSIVITVEMQALDGQGKVSNAVIKQLENDFMSIYNDLMTSPQCDERVQEISDVVFEDQGQDGSYTIPSGSTLFSLTMIVKGKCNVCRTDGIGGRTTLFSAGEPEHPIIYLLPSQSLPTFSAPSNYTKSNNAATQTLVIDETAPIFTGLLIDQDQDPYGYLGRLRPLEDSPQPNAEKFPLFAAKLTKKTKSKVKFRSKLKRQLSSSKSTTRRLEMRMRRPQRRRRRRLSKNAYLISSNQIQDNLFQKRFFSPGRTHSQNSNLDDEIQVDVSHLFLKDTKETQARNYQDSSYESKKGKSKSKKESKKGKSKSMKESKKGKSKSMKESEKGKSESKSSSKSENKANPTSGSSRSKDTNCDGNFHARPSEEEFRIAFNALINGGVSRSNRKPPRVGSQNHRVSSVVQVTERTGAQCSPIVEEFESILTIAVFGSTTELDELASVIKQVYNYLQDTATCDSAYFRRVTGTRIIETNCNPWQCSHSFLLHGVCRGLGCSLEKLSFFQNNEVQRRILAERWERPRINPRARPLNTHRADKNEVIKNAASDFACYCPVFNQNKGPPQINEFHIFLSIVIGILQENGSIKGIIYGGNLTETFLTDTPSLPTTNMPNGSPTRLPTNIPTNMPMKMQTATPTNVFITPSPIQIPTVNPITTASPTVQTSTTSPTLPITYSPDSSSPAIPITDSPGRSTSTPTGQPSVPSTTSVQPSLQPSKGLQVPSFQPSLQPTEGSSVIPTVSTQPSGVPSITPSISKEPVEIFVVER